MANVKGAAYGTAGAIMSVPNPHYMHVRVTAGPRGCRVFLDLQTGTVGSGLILWRTFATRALAEADLPIIAATTPASPFVPMHNLLAEPVTSVVEMGKSIVDGGTLYGPVNPSYIMRDTGAAANGFFHIGGERMRPSMPLGPGRVFQAWAGTAGLNAWYNSVYIEEPGFPSVDFNP